MIWETILKFQDCYPDLKADTNASYPLGWEMSIFSLYALHMTLTKKSQPLQNICLVYDEKSTS